jgi:hypothetical protein
MSALVRLEDLVALRLEALMVEALRCLKKAQCLLSVPVEAARSFTTAL